MNNIFNLKGKVALVTGAAGYLGQAMVEGLAAAGAIVYSNGRTEEKINNLVSLMTAKGYDVRPAIFDITNEDEINNFLPKLESSKLDILVNNAYNGVAGSVETSTKENYMKSYEVTIGATHSLVKLSLPYLRNAKAVSGDASVINISSMYGMVSPDMRVYASKDVANPPFYGAAKAALIQWTKYAACEFAQEGIRFNSISPGAFPSKVVQETNQELILDLVKKIPMSRVGSPSDLVGPLIFLASDSAGYVTGVNIPIDGGWTAW